MTRQTVPMDDNDVSSCFEEVTRSTALPATLRVSLVESAVQCIQQPVVTQVNMTGSALPLSGILPSIPPSQMSELQQKDPTNLWHEYWCKNGSCRMGSHCVSTVTWGGTLSRPSSARCVSCMASRSHIQIIPPETGKWSGSTGHSMICCGRCHQPRRDDGQTSCQKLYMRTTPRHTPVLDTPPIT